MAKNSQQTDFLVRNFNFRMNNLLKLVWTLRVPNFSELKYRDVSIVPTIVQVVDVSEATTLKSGLFEGSNAHFTCKTVHILLMKLRTLILQIV